MLSIFWVLRGLHPDVRRFKIGLGVYTKFDEAWGVVANTSTSLYIIRGAEQIEGQIENEPDNDHDH